MTNIDKAEGIGEAYDQVMLMHDRIEIEHNTTPSGLFGMPTRKHHELMAQSRVLRELGRKLAKMHVAALTAGWLLFAYRGGVAPTVYDTEKDCEIAAQYFNGNDSSCIPDGPEVRSWQGKQ